MLDFETTGLLDDAEAEILEAGALLVEPADDAAADGGLRLATLDLLVRPRGEVPRAIQRLTGITDALVAAALPIEEAARGIVAALAGRVVIAHNAPFERSFLLRFVSSGFDTATFLDTQDLLAVTHPDAPDLRLESFTRALLGTEERHRALDDALDTARVLSRVAEGARRGVARYATAREALARFAPDSPWLALLATPKGDGGSDDGAPAVLGAAAAGEPGPDADVVVVGASPEPPVAFDGEAIAAALADEARGRRHFPGYRVREEQIALARRFAERLASGGMLLLEGGTGVGKSLAYLAAAIPFAMGRAKATGRAAPVVISTKTKLLQDQLLAKDIGAAARMLGHPGLRAVSIKGRANYVCARRLATTLAEGLEPRIFAEDRMAWAVLLATARTRAQGEVGSVPIAWKRRYPALHGLLRQAVSSRAEQCSREQCATQGDACPFARRRAAIAQAHLVVANHDLLLRWPPDYPAFSAAIVDEVHELAGVADEVYAQEVRPEDVIERIDEVFGRPGEGRRAGGDALLPSRVRRAAARDAAAFRRAVQQDLLALGRALGPHASDFGELQLPERPGRALEPAVTQADATARRLDAVADAIERLGAAEDAGDGEPPAWMRSVGDLRAASATLRLALAGGGSDAVAAFEGLAAPWDRWRLALRPVAPAEAFHERFLAKLDCFAGVSASLFVGGSAFAATGELELEERADGRLVRESVPSPFSYATHMRVVALDTPDAALVEETANVVGDLARLLGGRTLGLFTSLRRMRDVGDLLAERLRPDGIDVLMPRRALDDPASVVERFRRGNAVLLGARTFWQGLDLPGEALQAVVIEKLPFDVPNELRRRREARLRARGFDPFDRYTLGKMLLHLKQMSGRLIRSEEDRGIVVIVEGRPGKPYFRKLGGALPGGCAVRVVKRTDLPGVLAEVGLPGPGAGEDGPAR